MKYNGGYAAPSHYDSLYNTTNSTPFVPFEKSIYYPVSARRTVTSEFNNYDSINKIKPPSPKMQRMNTYTHGREGGNNRQNDWDTIQKLL